MPRFLVAACAMLAGFVPIGAGALGLGEIDLKSALNQPFRAEIPLTADAGEDLSAVTVELAGTDTFSRYGLDRAAFLEGFRFDVEERGGGPVLLVTSGNRVAEPFVTMLLEVRWPQGRLLREYTVLLDPPVFAARPEPAAAPAAAQAPRPAPRPAEPAAAPAARPPAPVTPPAPVSAPALPAAGDTYGPVQRNETLWGISRRLRGDAPVDINQIMLAIYRANPEAFGGNINQLKRGAILRVPDSEELSRIGRGEAFSEVRRQNERGKSAAAGAEPARLRRVPPSETPEEAAEQAPAAATPARTAAPAATDSGEAERLRDRVSDLETTLAERERLLELRDQELSELQAQLARLRDETPAVTPPAAEDAGAGVEEELPSAEEIRAALEGDADAGETPAQPGAEAEPAEPPAVTSVTTAPADEPSFIVSLLQNWWLYAAMAAVVLVALFLSRRGASRSEDDTGRWEALEPGEADIDEESREATERLRALRQGDESIVVEEGPASADSLSGAISAAAAADIEEGTAAPGAGSQEQESPLERTISADSPVNLDEADPVAEADFHMAYGLYDQAADILIKAREEEPERRDLQVKLLDVYFVWQNKAAFLKEAEAFRQTVTDESDPDWNKVLILGKQICPEEPLFAGAVGAADDLDLSIGEEEGGTRVDLALSEDDIAEGVDLDLEDGGTATDFDADDAAESLDLDFDDESDDTPEEESTVVDFGQGESPTVETPTIETGGPGSETIESPTLETGGPGSSTVESPTLSTPMGEATMESPTIETPAAGGEQTSEMTAEIELDDLGLDLDGLDDAADTGLEDIVSDLGDMADEPGASEGGTEPADSDGDLAESDAETMLASELDDETRMHGSTNLDATAEFDVGGHDFTDEDDEEGVLDVESTAEMQGLSESPGEATDLNALTAALEKEAGGPPGGDTAEQPAVGDTAEQPRPGSDEPAEDIFAEELLAADGGEDLTSGVDLDLGDAEEIAADEPTGTIDITREQPEGPTMTEVGTKLDLARAYIDMGDPDGARSILSEVLEEGEEAQRQEAQKLLDDLGD